MFIKKMTAAIAISLLVSTVSAQEYKVVETRVWDDGSLRLKLEDTATQGEYLSNSSCFSNGNNSPQNVDLKDFFLQI